MTAALDLRAVTKAFGPTLVLGGVDCALEAGTITAILGGNGAGKSTLLKIMGGVLAPSSGAVQAGSPPRPVRGVRDALAAGVRFIHQEGSLIPAWTVAEHFPGGGPDSWRALAPGIAGGARIEQLDAHDRQLLESARALQGRPAVVLADEPTAGLGPEERDRVFAALRAAAEAGAAVAVVTHDLDAAQTRTDHVLVLRGGRIVQEAPSRDLSRTDLLEAMGVAVGEAAAGGRIAPEGGAAVLTLRPRPAAQSVDLVAGQIVGLVGGAASGAGDMVRAASGLPPRGDAGQPRRPPPGLAYMSREMAEWDFPGLPVAFNLNAATWRGKARGGVMDRAAEAAGAKALRDTYHVVTPSLDHPIEQLSGGNRQKAVLARLAASKPRVLLLDEPFSGVDAPTRAALAEQLRRLAAEGMAIGIYSQELADLAAASDRVVVLGDDGRAVTLDAAEATPALIEAVIADTHTAKATAS
jgi:ABC-type sugar transport system ATPase subunit